MIIPNLPNIFKPRVFPNETKPAKWIKAWRRAVQKCVHVFISAKKPVGLHHSGRHSHHHHSVMTKQNCRLCFLVLVGLWVCNSLMSSSLFWSTCWPTQWWQTELLSPQEHRRSSRKRLETQSIILNIFFIVHTEISTNSLLSSSSSHIYLIFSNKPAGLWFPAADVFVSDVSRASEVLQGVLVVASFSKDKSEYWIQFVFIRWRSWYLYVEQDRKLKLAMSWALLMTEIQIWE